jgi:hypothetical protein
MFNRIAIILALTAAASSAEAAHDPICREDKLMDAPTTTTTDALDDELTVIRLARLLEDPDATGLDSHRERIIHYARHGVGPTNGMRFDRQAVRRANLLRAMDDRELIEL